MKMSGASPELSAVWSLPSMSSFWMAWMVIFTPGFAASKSAAVVAQNALPSPVVELCQNVIATSPPAEAVSLPLSPPPQALSPTTPIAMAAVTARIFRAFIRSVLFVELARVKVAPRGANQGPQPPPVRQPVPAVPCLPSLRRCRPVVVDSGAQSSLWQTKPCVVNRYR